MLRLFLVNEITYLVNEISKEEARCNMVLKREWYDHRRYKQFHSLQEIREHSTLRDE